MDQVNDQRMPAEWERQAAIWLSWPHNVETWPENLEAAQAEFVALVQAIAPSQPVMIMASAEQIETSKFATDGIKNVRWIPIPTNDAWARDYAPTFVKNSKDGLVAIDWRYNGWGEKYPPFDDDAKVAKWVAEHLDIKCVSPDFCFEGGALEVNGSGLLLSTSTCALNANRNKDASLSQVAALFAEHLGTQDVIWLNHAFIEGDDTDGHIDQLSRFTDEKTIVYAWQKQGNETSKFKMNRNLEDLKFQLMAKNLNDFRLVALPNPEPFSFCGRQIPASYCNFLIANELVIVPQFRQPTDEQAIEILKPLFASRQVIGLPSLNLSVGLGSFHCLSQQQPA